MGSPECYDSSISRSGKRKQVELPEKPALVQRQKPKQEKGKQRVHLPTTKGRYAVLTRPLVRRTVPETAQAEPASPAAQEADLDR